MATLIQDASIDTFALHFEQTVPRSLVHKRSLENVLLTEVIACGDDRFICAGRVPTVHRFFNDAGRTPQKDILFYTELGRQASLAVSHTFLGVGNGDVFIFEQSRAAVTEAALSTTFRLPPDSVVTEIKIQDIERRRNNAVNRVVAEHIMWIGSEQVFHGTGAWTVQPAALFQRLRKMSGMRASPQQPEICQFGNGIRTSRLGQERSDNVVISTPAYDGNRAEFVCSLIVDETHPYFFDHPCDHVPGMLLLEGCAQLALDSFAQITSVARRELAVCAYNVNFVKFLECSAPTILTAHLNASENCNGSLRPRTVEISISQQNVVSGTATMSVALPV